MAASAGDARQVLEAGETAAQHGVPEHDQVVQRQPVGKVTPGHVCPDDADAIPHEHHVVRTKPAVAPHSSQPRRAPPRGHAELDRAVLRTLLCGERER